MSLCVRHVHRIKAGRRSIPNEGQHSLQVSQLPSFRCFLYRSNVYQPTLFKGECPRPSKVSYFKEFHIFTRTIRLCFRYLWLRRNTYRSKGYNDLRAISGDCPFWLFPSRDIPKDQFTQQYYRFCSKTKGHSQRDRGNRP